MIVSIFFRVDGHHEPPEQPAACTAFEMTATYLQEEDGECADIVLYIMQFSYCGSFP